VVGSGAIARALLQARVSTQPLARARVQLDVAVRADRRLRDALDGRVAEALEQRLSARAQQLAHARARRHQVLDADDCIIGERDVVRLERRNKELEHAELGEGVLVGCSVGEVDQQHEPRVQQLLVPLQRCSRKRGRARARRAREQLVLGRRRERGDDLLGGDADGAPEDINNERDDPLLQRCRDHLRFQRRHRRARRERWVGAERARERERRAVAGEEAAEPCERFERGVIKPVGLLRRPQRRRDHHDLLAHGHRARDSRRHLCRPRHCVQ
jgi:hypothetical protein